MDKHTFKVGDRVVCIKGAGKRVGEKGQYWEGSHTDGSQNMWGIKFDIDSLNIPGKDEDFYSFGWIGEEDPLDYMIHDTDFRVGDWVRYEKTKDEGIWGNICFSDKTQAFKITALHSSLHCAIVGTDGVGGILCQSCYLDNLVKIQPPDEAQVKPIKIKHEKYGVVEGVNVLQGGLDHGFTKDGAHYFVGNGWSQVPETEWITIQVEKEGFDRLKRYENLYGYSDKTFMDNEYTKWRYPQ